MSAPTALAALLVELEAFGQQNDATITDRPRRMLNITRDTGEFLAVKRAALACYPSQLGDGEGGPGLDREWLEVFFGPTELFFELS